MRSTCSRATFAVSSCKSLAARQDGVARPLDAAQLTRRNAQARAGRVFWYWLGAVEAQRFPIYSVL